MVTSVNNDPGKEEQSELSLKYVLLKLWSIAYYVARKWAVILLLGVVGAGIGYFYSKTKVAQYIALTNFVLEDGSDAGVSQYAGVASMIGLNLGSGGAGIFQGDNLLELYKSRSILAKALLSKVIYNNREVLLIDVYLNVFNKRDDWRGSSLEVIKFEEGDVNGRDRVKDSIVNNVVEDIRENLILVDKMDKKLSILQVKTITPDELFSQLLNQKVVETVNEFYVHTKSKKSLDNIAILQRQTDSVRNVMNGAIYETAAAADATPNLNPARQVLRASGQRSQVNAEANKTILTQLIQNLELAKMAHRREAPLIQIIDYPILPLQKQQLGPRKAAVVGFLILAFISTSFFIIKYILKDILTSE